MKFNEIDVKIIRKKIKNIYFKIDDDGSILVTCPTLISDKEINNLLNKNSKSIERMLNRFKKNKVNKEKVLYLGKELEFIEFNRIMMDDERIYAPSQRSANLYLESICFNVFKERLDECSKSFDNLPKFKLRVRKMKTRWGVCNKGSMTVTLNKELIHKKVYLIDYVICHELSHFKYMNHSQAFWNEVSKHFPNYKEARKELNY